MVIIGRQRLIGEKLIKKNLIDKKILENAIENQKDTGEKIIEYLVRTKYISPEDGIEVVAEHIGIKGKSITLKEIKLEAFQSLSGHFMKKNAVLPFSYQGNKLNVVMAEPNNFYLVDEIQMKTGKSIIPYFCTKEIILSMIKKMSELRTKNSSEKVESILDELNKLGEDDIEIESSMEVEDIERSFASENALVVRGVNAMIARQ